MIKFGDYVLIEQNRFGTKNEMFIHKVIGTSKSNTYVDVPVMVTPYEKIHKDIVSVVSCICAGVSERDVYCYRLEDVKLIIANKGLKERAWDKLQDRLDNECEGNKSMNTNIQEYIIQARKEAEEIIVDKKE